MFDFATHDDLKIHSAGFVMSPTRWAELSGPLRLKWNEVPFESAQQQQVPEERGVYAFLVGIYRDDCPNFRFIMYVGETGNRSKSNLRRRFGDYLKEKSQAKRTKFYLLLNRWDGWIRFAYAAVPDRRRSLLKLEEALNRAFVPPLVRDDFPADIMGEVTAFRAFGS